MYSLYLSQTLWFESSSILTEGSWPFSGCSMQTLSSKQNEHWDIEWCDGGRHFFYIFLTDNITYSILGGANT